MATCSFFSAKSVAVFYQKNTKKTRFFAPWLNEKVICTKLHRHVCPWAPIPESLKIYTTMEPAQCIYQNEKWNRINTPWKINHWYEGINLKLWMIHFRATFLSESSLRSGRLTWNMSSWRLGRWFSFLNGWFVGSMLIFQGVNNSFYLTHFGFSLSGKINKHNQLSIPFLNL